MENDTQPHLGKPIEESRARRRKLYNKENGGMIKMILKYIIYLFYKQAGPALIQF